MDNTVFRRNAVLVGIDKVVDAFIVFNLVSLAVLACSQVVMRYVLRSPMLGVEEMCYFPTIWLYLGAAIKASSEKGQLMARVLEIFIHRQRPVYLLRSVAALCSSGVLIWLTYWGYDLLKYSLRMEKETDILFFPWLLIEGMAFVTFAAMLFYTLLEAWEYFKAYRVTDASAIKVSEEVEA